MLFSKVNFTQKRRPACALAVPFLLLAAAVPAVAQLERVGPISTAYGYPAWYQDKTGLTLEFCNPLNQAELVDGWCLLLPADVPSGTAPEVFPTNFSEEHFYWSATSLINFRAANGVTSRALLVLALEGAFGIGPVAAGDQVVFFRLRVSIPVLPYSGTYTVSHPYGTWTFPDLVAGDKLFYTEDIGLQCAPGQFDCALLGKGPFLLASNTPGGPELAPIAGPVPGKLYIADPARIGPITGSPVGQNLFRVVGPNGFSLESSDFALSGRVYTGAIPGRVTVDRASYSQSPTQKKVDVFATAYQTTQARIPGSPTPPVVAPVLAFFSSACGIDAVTGALIAPVGVPETQMSGAGSNYWGQSQPAGAIPLQVCVEDGTARDASGQVVPIFQQANVTDEISVTQALYDPSNSSLTVAAVSSETATPPTLTLSGYGVPLTGGQVALSPLAAPPSKVVVTSTRGGVGELQVKTGLATIIGGNLPVAVNDAVTILEDSGAAIINVLANDTLNGVSPIVFGPGVSVNIVVAARLGVASVNSANGTINYTPNPNANGNEGIGYTVTVNGVTSSAAYITITITPVNDVPVAVNDATATTVSATITFNVLVNDTDVDGTGDLANAANIVQGAPPAGGSFTVTGGAGGLVTFQATGAGTYTFTYQAQDLAGALSANAATVTVNVAGADFIVISRADYRVGSRRWRVSGTDSVLGGQTLTIAYANGTLADGTSLVGTEIGTAVVDAGGNWILDKTVPAGILDPNPTSTMYGTRPTAVRVTSPFNGLATRTFNLIK